MALLRTTGLQSAKSHVHAADERCPVCEQTIPNEKAHLVRARLEARERELSDVLKVQLSQEFAREKVSFEAKAREDGKKSAEAAMQARLFEMEQAKNAAEHQAQQLKASQDAVVNERVQEVREALAKDKTDEVNALKAQHATEKQKLTDDLERLKRRVEKENAEDLGEGAEVKLFEALKAEFGGDRIRRVQKGTPGADIIHEVIHNGIVCQQIVYDSKNRSQWRNEYVTKLRQDQQAIGADYAVLSTQKFPSGAEQFARKEGVIILNPRRVIAVAGLLREQIIQMHALRISSQARTKKTEELYDFVMSRRFAQLLDSIETEVNKMLEMEVAEQKSHTLVWAKRGRMLKALLKVHADVGFEIGRIIGTAEAVDHHVPS